LLVTFLQSALVCKRKIAHIAVTVRVRDGGLGAEIAWSLEGAQGGQSQEVEERTAIVVVCRSKVEGVG